MNFLKVLAARKTYLITARARKNKRTARMLASARKDHSIPLINILVVFFRIMDLAPANVHNPAKNEED